MLNASSVELCKEDSCPPDQLCIPTFTDFECKCKLGYGFTDVSGNQVCADVDECNLGKCAENSICTNSIGSYDCKCKEGYQGNF